MSVKPTVPQGQIGAATASGPARFVSTLSERAIVILGALLAWGLFVSLKGPIGWLELTNAGPMDSDAVMRLAQIKDLLAGQALFDLTQHRMNAPFGMEMHWSRLIDLPIAGLMVLGNFLFGPAYGEAFALTVWPLLVLLPALIIIGFVSREIGGMDAVLPCLVFAMSSPRNFAFLPGQIDHHNVQIALCLALALCVVFSQRTPKLAAAAGVIVAVTLSIGLESIAYVLICTAWYPALWILRGHERAPHMAYFSLGLLAATVLLTGGWVVPVSGLQAHCDVFSFAYAPALVVGAGGLYVLAKTDSSKDRRSTRLAASAALGAACILSIAAIAPECLKGPYASLTPELREIWFDRVAETQGIQSMFKHDIKSALALYPYLAIAIACGAWAIWHMARKKLPQVEGLVFLFALLVTGFLLGLVQMRALSTAAFFAIPVFAVFAGLIRAIINTNGQSPGNLSALIFAWILGTNATWVILSGVAGASAEDARMAGSSQGCGLPHEIATLNQFPPGVVVNGVDLGPWIVAYTQHGAVSGHYHRNEKGILDAHRALTSEPDQARKLIDARGGKYVTWCAPGPGGKVLKEANPKGLVAQVESGAVPTWLVPLNDKTKTGLRLFRVSPPTPALNQP